MFQFLFILFIWLVITIIYYFLGKLSIYNLSREKLFEIVASLSILSTYISKRSLLRSWHYLLFFMIFPFWIITLIQISEQLEQLQKWLFQLPNSIFITDTEPTFFIVMLGLGIGFYFILFIFLIRISPLLPQEYWKKYPEEKTIQVKIKRLRNQGFFISLILQLLFLHTMLNYTMIDDNRLINNEFGKINEQIIPLKNVENAKISFKRTIDVNSNNKSTITERLYPTFTITTNNKDYNLWTTGLDLSDSILQRIAFRLHQDSVQIGVNYPGIMEREKWKVTYNDKKYQQIMEVFDYVSLLTDNLFVPVALTNEVVVDNFVMRVDSAMFSNKANILEGSKNKSLLIYVTLTNNRANTVYFGTIANTKVVDRNLKEYEISFSAKEINSSAIPPNETIQIMRTFDVPVMLLYNLKLRYQPNMLHKKYIYFELESPTDYNNPWRRF